MRIFENVESFASKVNFVDENNVLVGYDTAPQCCEHADWFLCHDECNEPKARDNGLFTEEFLSQYKFDTTYFYEVTPAKKGGYSVLDEGGMVRFKLVAYDNKPLYLHIFNVHNGYYSHGFESSINGIAWKNGGL